MQERLIDFETLKSRIGELCLNNDDLFSAKAYERIIGVIEAMPTIAAEPVKHGRWIFGSSNSSSWMKCSLCCKSQSGQTATFSYCPNCGARMDAKPESEVQDDDER